MNPRRSAIAIVGAIGFLCAWPVPAVAQKAPEIVDLEPANGATEVDPNTSELRVTFDRDMVTGNFSFCDDPQFPKVRGKPRFVNRRTAVLKVRLEPERDYVLHINCPNFMNFQAADGTPLEPVHWKFSTGKSLSKSSQKTLNKQSFKELMEVLRNEYSYLDRKKVDWKKLERQHRKRIASAKDTREWVDRVARMLSVAEDLHMTLEFGGALRGTYMRNVRPNFDLDGVKAVIPGLQQRNRAVWTGRTDDDFGYLLIAGWDRKLEQDLKELQSVLEEFQGTKGLIIDVRPNSGGDENLARAVASWFIEGEKVYAKNANRDAHSKTGFGPTYSRTIKGNDPPRTYEKPVCVLMGRANMSSCEGFLLMMKQGRDVTLLGSKSYGSSGNPKPFELENGVIVNVPSWKAMRPDGTPFEGEGLLPDIKIKVSPDRLKTGDPIIERALKRLREPRQGSAREKEPRD